MRRKLSNNALLSKLASVGIARGEKKQLITTRALRNQSIGLLMWFSVLPIYAQNAGETLVNKLNAIHSISADFSQSINAKHKKINQEQGHMAVERPGHFRWETKKPISQILMADGQHVWIYDPELEQVTIKPQGKALRGTPASFLSSSNDTLLDDFEVKLELKDGLEVYYLKAKSAHPPFVNMVLSFKGEQLHSLFLEDQLGQKTDVHLNQVKQNLPLPKKYFKFIPPRGVDVIRE
jgi:outer membrane lipoprotein carrier protein